MTIKSLEQQTETIKINTFCLVVDGVRMTYQEHLNDKEKVTDFTLRDIDGVEINDNNEWGFSNVAELVEQIQNFVDELPVIR